VGPAPAVAEVRVAVRRVLAELPAGALVLVACSGGADSTALAVATAFEAPRAGLRAGLLTVDHQLQAGSGEQASRVEAWAEKLGLAPVEVLKVDVGRAGGPEAAARTARYAALDDAAARHSAAAILLGHTLDDQAETVLLALARGSGARALAGMAPKRGVYQRPLLGVTRATTRAACAAEELPTWDDPHNIDPAYARSRLRALWPALEDAVGRGAVAGLARSASQLRADADLLDELAADLRATVTADGALDAVALAAQPAALRTRVLHGWGGALCGGAPTASHVEALDALVMAWRGQGAVGLPGGVRVRRVAGWLRADGASL
jgi:tRNA(Ile)-lysidine synthase